MNLIEHAWICARPWLVIAFASYSAVTWAGSNKAPTVNITAPATGAAFGAPANITISATASDTDGTVAKVEFFQGANLLGTRTASPYSISWNNVLAGTYSLTARATDSGGASRTSSAISVIVTGPGLLIASPASGSIVYGSSIAVSGTFSGDSSSTVLVDNGNTTRLATVTGNAYTATVPIQYGPNTLRVAVARRDKSSDAASITIIGNGNPLVAFTGPVTTVFDAPAATTLVVDAASPGGTIGRVDFLRNGALLGSAASAPYQLAWQNMPTGTYTVTAIATDTSGHTGTASLPITVNGPNVPPMISLTAPAPGANFMAPATISLSANATDSDGAVTKVEFLQNGGVIGVTNVSPYRVTWSNVPAGAYSLTARATDNRAGVGTSAPVAISVGPANVPPNVSLANPVRGSSFTAPATIDLVATASDSDGAVAKVDFYQGATLIGSAANAPYVARWANVVAGNYTLTARATDNGGASAVSAPVDVIVTNNRVPTVSLSSPSPGASYSAPAMIALAATASDSDGVIANVDFYEGASLLGRATAPPFAFTWTNVPAGSYSLTAKATDNAGAVATSAAVDVSVATAVLSIDTPPANAIIDGESIAVSGSFQAPPNSGVSVNGVVAAVDRGHLYANNVALSAGANTITATLTTPDGVAATRTLSVNSTGSAPVRITASPAWGLAPLAVSVDVTPQPGITLQKVEIDGDSNGTIDGTLLAVPWAATLSYSGVGTMTATVRATDTSGRVYAQSFPIVLTDPAVLDQSLRAVWNGMKGALTVGDKAAAMKFLDASAQQRYARVFDVLLPEMAQIAATFSDLQSVSLSDGLGEYAVNRTINGESRLFFIYFGRSGDGVWRLGSM